MQNKARTIWIYTESNDDNPLPCNITMAFYSEEDARKLLKKRVFAFTDANTWKDVRKFADGELYEHTPNSVAMNFNNSMYLWNIYPAIAKYRPIDTYSVLDLGKYHITFDGLQIDNDTNTPLLLTKIFEFSEENPEKPLNNGKPVWTFYTKYGGPECLYGFKENDIEKCLLNRYYHKNYELIDLCEVRERFLNSHK